MMPRQTLIALSFFILFSLSCQNDKLPKIHFSKTESFKSQIINDSYKLYYFLPEDYNENQNYPVIYLLDGDYYAERLAQEISLLWEVNAIPKCILVGIGNSNQRDRDYTYPTDSDYDKSSGHADLFYKFLTTELMPYIENNYAVDTNSTLLLGHSLGGFFSLYAMFNDQMVNTNYFQGFVAASPAVRWAEGYLLNLEEEMAAQKETVDCSLFLSSGSDERVVFNILTIEIYERLKNRNYSGFQIDYKNYKRKPHDGTPIPTFVDGLIFYFNQN